MMKEFHPAKCRLEVGLCIGAGAFGSVHLCRADCHVCVVKVMQKDSLRATKQEAQIVTEASLLADVSGHPFIAHVRGRWQDAHGLFLASDYVGGGELYRHLTAAYEASGRTRGFPLPVARFYIAQVLCALDYIHSKSIVYRDLKPENLVLGVDGYLAVVDFGFAARLAPGERSYALCGTPEYLAPEIIWSKGHDKGCDYWALGVLLYELAVGVPPFTAADPLSIYKNVARGDVHLPAYLDGATRSLLRHLLTADTTQRYGCLKDGAADIYRHRFFDAFDWEALLDKTMPAPVLPPPLLDVADQALWASSGGGSAEGVALQRRMDAMRTPEAPRPQLASPVGDGPSEPGTLNHKSRSGAGASAAPAGGSLQGQSSSHDRDPNDVFADW